ncbi:hypothetical protein L873DRAFT_270551 [Choiromyces venosus 120613-1]|uniref:Uncharacterized protein n=1 Tax=Choiromyces venosus 120613-1 TaxID=1336337 RepID=A0A3N4J3M8_9PEZI|nr:hypothetical protein L873DRAFT_270551 [Choiromyces venosus 120613-1]
MGVMSWHTGWGGVCFVCLLVNLQPSTLPLLTALTPSSASLFFLPFPILHALELIVPRLQCVATTPACSLAHNWRHSFRVPDSSM